MKVLSRSEKTGYDFDIPLHVLGAVLPSGLKSGSSLYSTSNKQVQYGDFTNQAHILEASPKGCGFQRPSLKTRGHKNKN